MSTTYRLHVTNSSNAFENFAVYQNDPDLGVYNVVSLAWFAKGAHPTQNLLFEWTIDYSIMWSEVGLTGNSGSPVTFIVNQEVDVDPADTGNNHASNASSPCSAACCNCSSVTMRGSRNGSTHSRRSAVRCAPQPRSSPRSTANERT